MLKAFRVLSLIEGLSLISLFCIAMPVKYYFGYFDIVWPVGMTHGLLWISLVVFSLSVSHKQGWSVFFWMLVLLVSVIPFACFVLDRKLKQPMELTTAAV